MDRLFTHIDDYVKNNPYEPVYVSDMLFDQGALIRALDNINEMDNNTLVNIVSNNLYTLIDNMVESPNKEYIKAFNNERFISTLITCISGVNMMDKYLMYINKIAYDYINQKCNESNESMIKLYLELGKRVNIRLFSKLMGRGISENTAAYILISRFSSQDEMINTHRLNKTLMKSDPDFMTPQMIIYIYEDLFNNLTELFKHVMYDAYTKEQIFKVNGKHASEIYSNISLAIADILNGAPSQNIYTVIKSYGDDYSVLGGGNVRFNIRSLAVCDYSRILSMVDYYENVTHNIIP